MGGLESSLALNTALGLVGLTVAAPSPDSPGVSGSFEQLLTPLIGALTAPGLPTLAFWGAAYGLAVEHEMRVPPWLRGVIFALVPMAVSLYAIFPLATWGLFGVSVDRLWEPLAIEAGRHLVYGLTLGVVYPLLLRRSTEPNGSTSQPAEAPA